MSSSQPSPTSLRCSWQDGSQPEGILPRLFLPTHALPSRPFVVDLRLVLIPRLFRGLVLHVLQRLAAGLADLAGDVADGREALLDDLAQRVADDGEGTWRAVRSSIKSVSRRGEGRCRTFPVGVQRSIGGDVGHLLEDRVHAVTSLGWLSEVS